jgi:putative aldouronate transport system substrate-binding protein
MFSEIRKIVGLILMLVALMALAACSTPEPDADTSTDTDTDTDTEEMDEPIELSLMWTDEGPWLEANNDSYTIDLMGQANNVDFDLQNITLDVMADKVAIALASQELPDIMLLVGTNEVPGALLAGQYGPQGMFVKLDEYIDAGMMPNMAAQMEKYSDMEARITSPDGHIYMAPSISLQLSFKPGLGMRPDLLAACGYLPDNRTPEYEWLQTTDDLYDAFECMSEQLGGGPVISNREGFARVAIGWAKYFGTGVAEYHNPATGQYEVGPTMDRYRHMITFMNRIFNDGLLHPDYATMSDPDNSNLAYGECTIGAFMEHLGWSFYGCNFIGLDPGTHFTSPSLTIDGERILWPQSSAIDLEMPMVVSALSSKEHQDAAVRVIDWLYGQEGAELMGFGEQGVHWDRNPDGTACFMGAFWSHEDGEDPGTACADAIVDENGRPGTSASGVPVFFDLFIMNQRIPRIRRMGGGIDYQGYSCWPGPGYCNMQQDMLQNVLGASGSLTDPLPPIVLNDAELEIVADVGTPLTTFVLEETQKMIEAAAPPTDAEWAEFVSGVEGFNAQALADAYNAALARIP